MLFYWHTLLCPFFDFYYFSISLLSVYGWYCGARVFVLIGCRLLNPSLSLPTSFNNNNNSNNNNNNNNKVYAYWMGM